MGVIGILQSDEVNGNKEWTAINLYVIIRNQQLKGFQSNKTSKATPKKLKKMVHFQPKNEKKVNREQKNEKKLENKNQKMIKKGQKWSKKAIFSTFEAN